MAEMWYYTSEGKQMEPVTNSELKQLATSGMLKPTDMVWKEGMPKWVRASSTKDLFSDTGVSSPAKKAAPEEERRRPSEEARRREDSDDRPRKSRRRDRDYEEDEDDDDRPRRRRRRPQDAGMSTGLKVGLILGGSLLGILVIVIIIVAVSQSGNNARVQIQAPPVIQFKNAPPVNLANRKHAPVFRGPLAVGGGAGLTINDRLTMADSRDFAMNTPCKVFTVNMTAGKTYTIRHTNAGGNRKVINNRNINFFDPYLRLEDSNFTELARDDDSGGNLNSLLIYRPNQTGVYRVIATCLDPENPGSFILQITES